MWLCVSPRPPGLSRLGDASGTDVDDAIAIDNDDNYDYPDADGESGGDGEDDCVGLGRIGACRMRACVRFRMKLRGPGAVGANAPSQRHVACARIHFRLTCAFGANAPLQRYAYTRNLKCSWPQTGRHSHTNYIPGGSEITETHGW